MKSTYTIEESLVLVTAQSSKLVESEPQNLNSYFDNNCYSENESHTLVLAQSSVMTIPESVIQPHSYLSYREEEIWALVNCSYDPRNYVHVPKFNRTIKE